MDFDFCLEEDRVQSFLQNKLEEIKAKNDKLRHALYDRQQFLRGITESCNVEMDENNVRISPEAWKKVFNDKYVFGVTIENNENRNVHFQSVNVFLVA
ncbi:hypothetical protein NQ315_009710 [Exocentrus adspersus]|uniref:Uncharacterized protein n=1 Tax=Exocentrus adspersus TaxID=1586481 RepID=A0AAV8WHE5_9CUCU|nr:hypothetical protein NQ315_009710 [Exocentrus adspersus]